MAHGIGRWAALGARRVVGVGIVLVLGGVIGMGVNGTQASTTAGAVFLREAPDANSSSNQTNSISVGVDAAGGMHASFTTVSEDSGGNHHAYYDFCAAGADCATTANWTMVTLLTVDADTTFMHGAQLQVNAQGDPRLVIMTGDREDPYLDHYYYAACDSGCTSQANWTVVEASQAFIGANTFISSGNKHFFALDHQGRPRFIVDNGNNYVYVFCNSGCTTAANWDELELNGVSGGSLGFNTAALAFNSTGHPRMVAPATDQKTFYADLHYWECNANDCATNADSWTNGPIIEEMNGEQAVYSSLRLTSTGQPRFGYYGTFSSDENTLFYMWCNTGCTNAANWTHRSVGLVPAHDFDRAGQNPDLALDANDNPRLAFQALEESLGSGLGYAWCDEDCEAAGATWEAAVIDSNDQMNADWNRDPFGCGFNSWVGGYRLSLVLAADGSPRIGHDVQHFISQCAVPSIEGVDYVAVRFVYLPEEALPSEHVVYVPLVSR
jgi:hypothetical protein